MADNNAVWKWGNQQKYHAEIKEELGKKLEKSNATKVEGSTVNGNIKINDTETAVYAHPESGVTAGTYQTVTVDKNGHITAGSNAIMQNNSETNSNFRLLLSGGANDTTQGSSINKSANFTANPSTGSFYAKGFARINIGGKTLDINDFNLSDGTTDSMYYIVKTSGGASNIANIPIANTPFILDVHLIRYGNETDYITMQKFISVDIQQNEYVRYCTSGTWSEWVKRDFTEYVHPNSGVNSGTYSTVTVNSQGHVIAGWQGTKQSPSEADSNFRLLLSGQANDTEQMSIINKSVNFTANPFTGAFYAKGFNRIDISADEVDINTLNLSDGASHSMHYIVTNDTGSANKLNIPIANRAFILDVYLIRYSDETDYITAQRFVTSGDMNNEYIRYCSNGVWSEWYKQFLISSESVMQSKLVAESNTGYTVPQVRNITMSTEAASGGNNGQVHFQYV